MVSLAQMTKVSILNTRGISDNKFDIHCHLTLNRANMFINDYICLVLVLPIIRKVISVYLEFSAILTYPWRFIAKSIGLMDSSHHRNIPFSAYSISLPLYCSLLHFLISDMLDILWVCLLIFCPSLPDVSSLKTKGFSYVSVLFTVITLAPRTDTCWKITFENVGKILKRVSKCELE